VRRGNFRNSRCLHWISLLSRSRKNPALFCVFVVDQPNLFRSFRIETFPLLISIRNQQFAPQTGLDKLGSVEPTLFVLGGPKLFHSCRIKTVPRGRPNSFRTWSTAILSGTEQTRVLNRILDRSKLCWHTQSSRASSTIPFSYLVDRSFVVRPVIGGQAIFVPSRPQTFHSRKTKLARPNSFVIGQPQPVVGKPKLSRC
jgi:hypothetical protein